MEIIIVGEDQVTWEIIKRLLDYSDRDFSNIIEEPVRGGEIKRKAPNYNLLGLPVIILTDLDEYDCPSSLITDWFQGVELNPNFIFRVACDEAESWLMADKQGFSEFLEISEEQLPDIRHIDFRNSENIELSFPYKPSLYLMRELAQRSPDVELKRQLTPRRFAKKGPEYNSALIPFIQNHWNIDAAAQNSYSLRKAIARISEFNPV